MLETWVFEGFYNCRETLEVCIPWPTVLNKVWFMGDVASVYTLGCFKGHSLSSLIVSCVSTEAALRES